LESAPGRTDRGDRAGCPAPRDPRPSSPSFRNSRCGGYRPPSAPHPRGVHPAQRPASAPPGASSARRSDRRCPAARRRARAPPAACRSAHHQSSVWCVLPCPPPRVGIMAQHTEFVTPSPRLICIAADFTKYDTHAVKQMGRNIELVRYRRFGNDLLLLEVLAAVSISPGQVLTTSVESGAA